MQPPRTTIRLGASLAAALVVAAVDLLVARRAWAPVTDRLVLVGAVGCALAAAAALAWSFTAIVAPRSRALAAAPLVLGLAALFGTTMTAQRFAGSAAPFLSVLPLATVAWAFDVGSRAISATGDATNRSPRRWLSFACLAAGLLCLIADAALPRHLYPALRLTLLAAGFLALARGLNGLTIPIKGSILTPASPPLAGLLLFAPLAIAAALCLRVSANVRFVAAEYAPATALLLEGVTRLAPHLPLADAATRARSTPDRAADAVAPSSAARLSNEAALTPLGDAHLLVVTVDALRADRLLPRLASLAAHGVRFTRAYAQAPHTAFSVTSLLTGVHPDRLSPEAGRPPPTLADQLRARRWETEAFYPAGLFFDGRGALAAYAHSRFGFEWTDTRTVDATALTDAVLARLGELHRRGEPRGFFWVHYFDTHEPYGAPSGTAATDAPLVRYNRAATHVDDELARLVAALGSLTRPTLVVVTADHGEEFGEHGGAYHGTTLYEEQIHVPLAVFTVGGPPLGPRTIDVPVELADLAPTLYQLLAVPAPPLEGASLVPLLVGEEPPFARDVHAQVHSKRLLVRGPLKLIHDLRGNVNELYDLDADPKEERNRFDGRPELSGPLLARLEQWFNLSSPAALAHTLTDRAAPTPARIAAAQGLGQLIATQETPSVRSVLEDPDPRVRAEAALALAELGDRAVAPRLAALLDELPYRRRAALALGRLRDARSVPALLEATRDINPTVRRHAHHYLGFLAGQEAVAPIIDGARKDLKARADAYLALGRIAARTGSPAARAFLVERLPVEEYEDARSHLAWALGLAAQAQAQLPDPRTTAALAVAAIAEPPLPLASEALVRASTRSGSTVGGIDRIEGIGGIDFAPGLHLAGVAACRRDEDEQHFAGVTTCVQSAPHLKVRSNAAPGPAVLLFRARSLVDGPLEETLLVNGRPVANLSLTARFVETRVALPADLLRARDNQLELVAHTPTTGGPLAELDHLLLVPVTWLTTP
jgi:hypothetical protein